MPGVTPSDGGYQYYKTAVDDIEKDFRNQTKRAREREDERVAALEKKQAETLQNRQEKMNQAVENIRNTANDEVERSLNNHREETERLRQQTYDRFGRYKGESADELQRDLQQTRETLEAERKSHEKNLEEQDRKQSQRIEDLRRDYSKRSEDEILAARTSANEAYEKANQEQKAAQAEDKRRTQDAYEKLVKDTTEARKQETEQSERAYSDLRRNFEHQLNQARTVNEHHVESQKRGYEEAANYQTKALNDSHAKETQQLRDQLKKLLENDRESAKDGANARQDAIKELETDWRIKQQLASESYERDLEKLRHDSKDTDSRFSRLSDEAIREKDQHYSRLFAEQNRNNHREQKSMQGAFESELESQQTRANKDRAEATQYLQDRMAEANQQRDEALQNQAKAYQGAIDRNRVIEKEKVDRLQKQIDNRAYVAGADGVATPAQEEAIRRAVINEYEKSFQADRERTDRAAEVMQQTYSERLRQSEEEAQARHSLTAQQSALERHHERSEMLRKIEDLELDKTTAVRAKDVDREREVETLNRNFTTSLDRQRRQYEELLQSQKIESQVRTQSMRDELEFNARMAQREFIGRQNDLIREYEKKLTAQKAEFEASMIDMKSQADQAVRESERRSRQSLEEQARQYEQKLAQSEVQHKEREKSIAQNYEDVIERMKNANALLVKKKA